MTAPLSFGSWLKHRRKELDFTQEELAQEVGCSAIAVRKMEADEYRPSKQIALRLADRLEVPASERDLFVQFARAEGQAEAAPFERQVDADTPWRVAPLRAETNLPAQLTRLIGREDELEQLSSFLLSPTVRLVTLTGPPGVGKTRLAVEVGSNLLDTFEDGVSFVALSSVSDPGMVVAAIAQVLGVKEAGQTSLAGGISAHLRGRHLLLVLDNFEQLMGAATQVETLLKACPHLSVLVTSREVLRVRGEQQFPVSPLRVPGANHSITVEALSKNPAVMLFVERARSVAPGFRLTEENARTVAAICARLEGLPLAIEIAAARIKILSPAAMLGLLESGSNALVGHTQPYRDQRQTLAGAIEWSYNLLDPTEQRLFTRLAVFRGGCLLAAIEAVCNARGDLSRDALALVESLVDKSLLAREETGDGEPRFALLETVREYALAALERAGKGEADALRRHHAEYYLALAEAAEPELRGTRQAFWLDRLEREHDNLRAALRFAQEYDADIALRLVAALWRYWWIRGHLSEGREWLGNILSQPQTEEHTLWRARALRGAGWLAYAQGAYLPARSLFEMSLVLFRGSDNDQGVASALDNLGAVAFTLGDYSEAGRLYEESLTIRKETGEQHAIATSLNNLGLVAATRGRYLEARPLLEESLSLYRVLDDAYGIATALNNLALVCRCEGDYNTALPLLKESLELRRTMTDRYAIAYSLAGFAGQAGGQPAGNSSAQRAVMLLAATQALLELIGARLEHAYLTEFDRTLAWARSRLGEVEFARAWQSGSSMTMEQAVDYALE